MFCRKALILTVLSLLMVSTLIATTTPSATTIQKMNKMPLPFTKNMGQWDERVLFRASAGGATMWFTKEGVTYQFTRRIGDENTPLNPLSRGDLAPFAAGSSQSVDDPLSSLVGQDRFGPDTSGLAGSAPNEPIPLLRGVRGVSDRDSIDQLVLTAKFIGANPNPEVITDGLMEYKCNYFIGNDPTKWHTDAPNYEAITLKDIYPGIDLRYSGDGTGQAAYEFIAAPGADIAQIKVEYEGAEETSPYSDGRLILKTKWGDMIAAVTEPTNGVLSGTTSFSQLPEEMIGFRTVGASQSALGEPGVTLSYSTYLGAGGEDFGIGIAVDWSGCACVTGMTYSTDFPMLNPYQGTYQGGYGDVFVTKLSSSGNSLIYSTYLGGDGNDQGSAIAVDGNGNAYVTGVASSSSFPTWDPLQTYQGSGDAFVIKLSSAGNSLIYGTCLGGSSQDLGYDIAIDGSGSAYLTGSTISSDFPTLNPFQTYQGGGDAFVAKLSSSGSSLTYSTCLGGGESDEGNGIAVDSNGNAYVTGQTYSSNFPTLNAYQSTYHVGQPYGGDVFVTKLSSSGSALVYSTYLGGNDEEAGFDIGVDGGGSAYVTGYTYSTDFPTLIPLQTYQGPTNTTDAFVTKLSHSGDKLIYSTYLCGENSEFGADIAVDGSGNAYLTGQTRSSNFPTQDAYDASFDTTGDWSYDAFVTKLSSSGTRLAYSTYLGGAQWDDGMGIAIDGSGNAYVTGFTISYMFPTLNPYQATHQGGYRDAFVTKLNAYPCGDADGNGFMNISDAVYLIAYIFSGGPAPNPEAAGDADCNGLLNITDAVYLINYIFSGGPTPCADCK